MRTILSVLMVLLLSLPVFAENNPPSPGTPTGAPPVPVGLPIDAWVFPLFVIGLLYGVKLYAKQQRAL